jgi:molecular chaperone DnaJ
MADIFEDLFGGLGGGGRGQRRQPDGRERGGDIRFNLQISLEEAFSGKTATITLPTAIACEPCNGSGATAGSKPKPCPTCNGYGRVRASQGFFAIERTCPKCQGRGQIIENPCRSCNGEGRVTKEKTLSVNIPAGVEEGTRIRLASEGEAGLNGSPPGDLYIFLANGKPLKLKFLLNLSLFSIFKIRIELLRKLFYCIICFMCFYFYAKKRK